MHFGLVHPGRRHIELSFCTAEVDLALAAVVIFDGEGGTTENNADNSQ